MAWPADNKVIIHSLPANATKISSVKMLGSKEKIKWKQTDVGLEITLPSKLPCKFAYGLKIEGN